MPAHTCLRCNQQRERSKACGQSDDSAQVHRGRPPPHGTDEARPQRWTRIGFRFQLRNAFGHQVVGDVPHLGIGGAFRQHHSPARHFDLADPAVTRDLLHDVAALIASCEIAARVNSARVSAQLRLHHADRFEDLGEIQARESPEAAERIGGGDPLGRFAGVLALDQMGERRLQALLDPALSRRERVLLVLKLLREADREIRLPRDRLGFHETDRALEHVRSHARTGRQAVSPKIGRLAQLLRPAHAYGEACQRFDQRHAQKQRENPKLDHGQRRYRLTRTQTV